MHRLTNFTSLIPPIHLEQGGSIRYARRWERVDGGSEFRGLFSRTCIFLTALRRKIREANHLHLGRLLLFLRRSWAMHKRKAYMVEPMAIEEETSEECFECITFWDKPILLAAFEGPPTEKQKGENPNKLFRYQ